jgi:hypothetical protein
MTFSFRNKGCILAAAILFGISQVEALCNISGTWSSSGDTIFVTEFSDLTFVANSQIGWKNQTGIIFSNNSISFNCCGGISGSIDETCKEITWNDSNHDHWSRPPRQYSVSTSLLSLGVSILDDGSITISTFSFFASGANTSNLPLSVGAGDNTGGSTLLSSITQGLAAVPRCISPECEITSTSTMLTISGLQIMTGSINATEDWTLSIINVSSVSWNINRVFNTGGAIDVDRFGLSLETTGGLPIHSQQIPSYIDLDMFLNTSSTGGFSIKNSAFEYLSPNSRQTVRFSPTGALFVFEAEAKYNSNSIPLFWSFAKPFADGTTWCNIGYESVDPRSLPRTVAVGDVQTLSMTMNLVATEVPVPSDVIDPFPAIDAFIPNSTLASQIATLTAVQYQLNGWIFGNNPASVPCLHEMSWWPLITSLFPADSPALKSMQKELTFFTTCGWQSSNYTGNYNTAHSCNISDGSKFGLTQRYASSGFYWCPWGPLQDQNVMMPIAVYYTALATGDMEWLASMKPALQAVQAYLSSRGLDITGPNGLVVFTSPSSGLADGGKHSANWYDVIEFGNQDAYLAVHGVWAMSCLSEIYKALGDAPASDRASIIHKASIIDFNELFWNDTFNSYMDWIDVEGNKRNYFYVDIAFTAILAGVADESKTSALFSHYDSRLAEIYSEYNVTPGNIWSPPCNLYPITNPLEYATQEGKMTFPMYENGGSFFHSAGLQFGALGTAGRADDAYTGFLGLMNSGFGETRGWAQQLYWGEVDSLVGFDPLNTALLSVWGFFRATFGVAPSFSGLVVVNSPAKNMEGARWNMSYLGRSTCVKVEQGTTKYCNGSAI